MLFNGEWFYGTDFHRGTVRVDPAGALRQGVWILFPSLLIFWTGKCSLTSDLSIYNAKELRRK